jgi:PTH2 family peptidyl-tRNA hydrolase
LRNFEYKQVILLRSDLKMSKGKIAAQSGHAAFSAAEEARKKFPKWWKSWIETGQCKIALKVGSEQELLKLEKEAKTLNLPSKLIHDRGLTEIPPGTITCLGIGPAPTNLINKITGELPLL